jgi:hypothetical protein
MQFPKQVGGDKAEKKLRSARVAACAAWEGCNGVRVFHKPVAGSVRCMIGPSRREAAAERQPYAEVGPRDAALDARRWEFRDG